LRCPEDDLRCPEVDLCYPEVDLCCPEVDLCCPEVDLCCPEVDLCCPEADLRCPEDDLCRPEAVSEQINIHFHTFNNYTYLYKKKYVMKIKEEVRKTLDSKTATKQMMDFSEVKNNVFSLVPLNLILIIILFVMTGCGGSKQSTDDFITVDVTKSYSPTKELILQDFMDVEYITLETNDEFVNQGFVQDIGKEYILVKNRNADGDIFVYDRTGKALRKINHKGQGGEEYTNIYNITLDEDNGEMFVNDINKRKIFVYDLFGKFRRNFNHNAKTFYTDIFNYDRDNLICYDAYNKEIAFVLISKQDGSITKEIHMPFKEKKFLQQRKTEGTSTFVVSPGPYRTIIPFNGKWLLLEHSSDTVYTFLSDYSLRPFLVRTPSVQSMDPEVMLLLRLCSDRYIFMETIKNVYDFSTDTGFPSDFLMYDRQEKAFFGYNVYNDDYSSQREIYMNILRPVNHEIESWQLLEAHRLVESYEKGELKGQLKDIAATLDEEDNPVIMLIKHKKQTQDTTK
jgi:hypothetical protein